MHYTGWANKNRTIFKVHHSCIWWDRKAFNIWKCSALYRE